MNIYPHLSECNCIWYKNTKPNGIWNHFYILIYIFFSTYFELTGLDGLFCVFFTSIFYWIYVYIYIFIYFCTINQVTELQIFFKKSVFLSLPLFILKATAFILYIYTYQNGLMQSAVFLFIIIYYHFFKHLTQLPYVSKSVCIYACVGFFFFFFYIFSACAYVGVTE